MLLDERRLFTQETSEKIRAGAERAALDVIDRIAERTKDMGALDRKKASITIVGEAMNSAYIEGRLSNMVDREQEQKASVLAGLVSSSTQTVQQILTTTAVFVRAVKPVYILLGAVLVLQLTDLVLHLLR